MSVLRLVQEGFIAAALFLIWSAISVLLYIANRWLSFAWVASSLALDRKSNLSGSFTVSVKCLNSFPDVRCSYMTRLGPFWVFTIWKSGTRFCQYNQHCNRDTWSGTQQNTLGVDDKAVSVSKRILVRFLNLNTLFCMRLLSKILRSGSK